MNGRTDIKSTAAYEAAPRWAQRSNAAEQNLEAIKGEIKKRHDESVQRLQEWIHQPSIAAENRGMNEGCELQIRLLKEAGFQRAEKAPTDGQPGVFATLDAGAERTV